MIPEGTPVTPKTPTVFFNVKMKKTPRVPPIMRLVTPRKTSKRKLPSKTPGGVSLRKKTEKKKKAKLGSSVKKTPLISVKKRKRAPSGPTIDGKTKKPSKKTKTGAAIDDSFVVPNFSDIAAAADQQSRPGKRQKEIQHLLPYQYALDTPIPVTRYNARHVKAVTRAAKAKKAKRRAIDHGKDK